MASRVNGSAEPGRLKWESNRCGAPFIGRLAQFVGYSTHAWWACGNTSGMKRTAGFTLIELMVTVAVIAILASVAVPNFRAYTENNRQTAQINALVASLNLARSEAIKRGAPVSVCKSNNGTTCAGTNWEDGWLVFVNDDDDDPAAVDSGEQILRIAPQLRGGHTLRGTANVNSFVTYSGRGFANATGTFTLCDSRGANRSRQVQIALTGRVALVNNAPSCP